MKRSIAFVSAMLLAANSSMAAPNLILNGDFELGNTGFSSSYAYRSPGFMTLDGSPLSWAMTLPSMISPWSPLRCLSPLLARSFSLAPALVSYATSVAAEYYDEGAGVFSNAASARKGKCCAFWKAPCELSFGTGEGLSTSQVQTNEYTPLPGLE